MSNIDELQKRRDDRVGDGQEEDLVNQSVLIVDVLFDVDVGDDRHEDGVHQLSHDRLQCVADFPVGLRDVSFVVGQPLDGHWVGREVRPMSTLRRVMERVTA
jgi:hypothetical protein